MRVILCHLKHLPSNRGLGNKSDGPASDGRGPFRESQFCFRFSLRGDGLDVNLAALQAEAILLRFFGSRGGYPGTRIVPEWRVRPWYSRFRLLFVMLKRLRPVRGFNSDAADSCGI